MQYSKEIPVVGKYDVVVLGGGPSGVCAAIEAARNGVKVLLVEATGMLGGMATSGLVGPFMTNYDQKGERPVVGGIYREILERLEKYHAVILPEHTDAPSIYTSFIEKYHQRVAPVDPFVLQIVLDELVTESGVKTLLYTRFVDAIHRDGKIQSVVLAALEGLVSVEADLFIDCTGNADVAASAGVPTWKGEEKSGVPQPGTLMFEIEGVDDDRYHERPERPVKAYRMPQEGRYKVNHHHVYSVDATSSESMTDAHMQARYQVLDAYRTLKEQTPGFENARITQVASVLGIRESRHIESEYKITTEDLTQGVKYDDRIAAYAFGMDVHGRNENMKGNFKIPTANVYYVPYRCMLPIGCENLLVAGKTVCCESQAAGAIRVMPCAMAMGQAAGAAAAIAAVQSIAPNEVSVAELQKLLEDHGAILN